VAVASELSYRGGSGHDPQRRDAPAGFLLEQRLCNNRLNRLGELRAYLSLLIRREYVDHTVHGFRSAGSMQSTKHEMAGFRGRQRELKGLQSAHFAAQDDGRILAPRLSAAVGET